MTLDQGIPSPFDEPQIWCVRGERDIDSLGVFVGWNPKLGTPVVLGDPISKLPIEQRCPPDH